ncbi:xylulokinase [Butyrivibrio sp. MC2013]|uniref:xylulokinase n=1 Tax=Butyrivibrio sp. MC2013 TaxID=1280686 RepID=UPI00041C1F39|nr:xylulokinase [Butyrivibrio sp. MC2013]
MLYIGIDLGTSAVKLLLMDEKGKICKIVSREYPLIFPHPGWSEQDPAKWIEAVEDGIKELIADCDAAQIAGIGAGGQMHGLVVLDEDDNVLRPAILWNDGRTGEETDYLNDVIGRDKLSEYTGNIAFAGFTAPKLLWMEKHEPELFARISKIMLPKDYINYMLTGVFSTDYSDASGMLLLDVKGRKWSSRMLEICHVREEQLPRLYESYEIVGTVRKELASRLGLPDNVKVCAGAGDNAAAAVGTGVCGNGACNISLGTSGTIFISSDEFSTDSGNSLHAFAHADGYYHLMGCMLSAASCNKWWMDEIIGTKDYASQQKDITPDKLGRGHVYYLPYLMGERAPHNDPLARSCFIGMTMDSTRADMTQAVLEGVAFGMRDSLEAARAMGVNVRSSMICGGGAQSPLWRKIFTNVMNITLTIPETEQGPGYGGAILAAVGCGEYESVRQAVAELVRVTGSENPDPELAALYEEKYRNYRRLYPALKDIFHDISK